MVERIDLYKCERCGRVYDYLDAALKCEAEDKGEVNKRIEMVLTKTSDYLYREDLVFENLEGFLDYVESVGKDVIISYYNEEWREDRKGWNLEIYDEYRE